MYIIDIKNNTIALLKLFHSILLLENSKFSLLKSIALIPKKIIPIVVVFIPPPVEPGEAPINMSIINKKVEASFKSTNDIVLKPAVLTDTL